MAKADIGLIGLAVMGENFVLNMESKGYSVAVFNRTVEKVDRFVDGRAKGKRIIGCRSIEELCASIARPRKVMMLVQAGKAVDALIEQLLPHLEPGDVIIDGGNTHFPDTARRCAYVESKGLLYIGTGVSGGEEGALLGPSMMPGGSPGRLAARQGYLPVHLRADRGRRTLLRLGRRRRRGPLRQDGAQRHRVRRHADDLRDVPVDARRPGDVE